MPTVHFKIQLELFVPRKSVPELLSLSCLEANITAAASTLFGAVGGAIPVQIHALNIKEQTFILSVGSEDAAAKIRAALTLRGSYQGHVCHYHVLAKEQRIIALNDVSANKYLIH